MTIAEFDLTGRKILLVGASRGIGLGIAEVLAESGAEVAIASLNIKSATAAAGKIKSAGGKAVAFAADATKYADMERLAVDVRNAFGPIDVLVNCVGDSIGKPLVPRPGQNEQGMSDEDWRFILDVNLTQAYAGCKAFGPHFLERQRGVVINVSGIAAFRVSPQRSAYAAAKAGVTSFTQSMAMEWAPFHVRVNAIAPGLFPDPAQMSAENFAKRIEQARSRVPLGRLGRMREVGLLALYLASDASEYVTGQTWCIDGGVSVA